MTTKANQFRGSAVDMLDFLWRSLQQHESHFLLFSLSDLDTAEIRCSSCKQAVLIGSREVIESLWLEWSMHLES